MFRKTAEYRTKNKFTQKEYQEFLEFADSKEMKEYRSLRKLLILPIWRLRKQIMKQKFSETPEYIIEQEIICSKRIKKSKNIMRLVPGRQEL